MKRSNRRRGVAAVLRWRSWVLALAPGLLLALAGAPPALAKRTRLLEVDLRTGKKRAIDQQKGRRTAADRQLDALLGSTMGRSFSTSELERISAALQRYLRTFRPRATARMLLFLYPGRVTKEALKEMREVLVDIDLVVDPCGRSVCQDSVAQHLELIGRSLKQAVLRTRDYKIRFKSVTVRAVIRIGGAEYEQYRFTANQVVDAARSRGASRLVRGAARAQAGYERAMLKAISRQLRQRRVRVARPVDVSRSGKSVTVKMEIRSDRVRYKTHVTNAFAAAARALRSSPLTPPSGDLSLIALIPHRGVERRSFRTTLQPWGLFLDRRLSREQLWSTYVVQKRKGARQLSFDDDEARGGRLRARDSGPDRTSEILSANFSRLAPCLQREAARSRRFRGVTLLFAVDGSGKAVGLRTKERGVSGRLRQCLKKELGRIRFQRHGGAPRQVSYPMYIQR